MSRQIRILMSFVVALLIIGLSHEVRAEVSAKTDHLGNYLRLQLVPSGPPSNPRIWSPRFRAGRGARSAEGMLNPTGDRRGDLWPSVAEAPQAPHHPWVVWSRFDGRGYNLVWSRWTTTGWTHPEWVYASRRDSGRALDPDIEFDSGNRPMMVWWRQTEGHGTVYFSLFRDSNWTEPVRVSPLNLNARHPSLFISSQGTVYVKYKTRLGIIVQSIRLDGSRSITDDINPQGHAADDVTTSEQAGGS